MIFELRIALPDDWSESTAAILAERLSTQELPETVSLALVGLNATERMRPRGVVLKVWDKAKA